MFTIQEVADMFHVTRKTVYNWINAGRLRAMRVGGTLRVDQAEIDRIKQGKPHA